MWTPQRKTHARKTSDMRPKTQADKAGLMRTHHRRKTEGFTVIFMAWHACTPQTSMDKNKTLAKTLRCACQDHARRAWHPGRALSTQSPCHAPGAVTMLPAASTLISAICSVQMFCVSPSQVLCVRRVAVLDPLGKACNPPPQAQAKPRPRTACRRSHHSMRSPQRETRAGRA